MLHLYLDESGDLGFDFINKKPSRFFTITILALANTDANRKLFIASKKTISRKLNPKNQSKVHELKGTGTSLEIKKYFYEQVANISFSIYSISLEKKRFHKLSLKTKDEIYNFITGLVVDKIPFREFGEDSIELIVDKSKTKIEILNFDHYITKKIRPKVDPNIIINIRHHKSHESYGLQACDLFSYGLFLKHERGMDEWREIYLEKIMLDEIYPEVK